MDSSNRIGDAIILTGEGAASGVEHRPCDSPDGAGAAALSGDRWCETERGRSRLLAERQMLNSLGLPFRLFLLKGGRLTFSFARIGGREIGAICQHNHPEAPPTLYLRASRATAVYPLPTIPWTPQDCIADLIVPLLGPEYPADSWKNPISGSEALQEKEEYP